MSEERVEVRTADDRWLPALALSEPRYDHANAWRRGGPTFLSISVQVDGWEHPINWPAEDVRYLDLHTWMEQSVVETAGREPIPDDFTALNAFFAPAPSLPGGEIP